jgi:methylated-DNA-[protein]-cysteine S-methyltransferase
MLLLHRIFRDEGSRWYCDDVTEIVHTAEFDSPLGTFRIASTERGLGYLDLPHANGFGLEGWLRRHAPGAKRKQGFSPNSAAIRQVLEYLDGKRIDFDLPLDLRGTEFQESVWKALLEIPYGETCTYQELARTVGKPKAVRAVGSANGANPIPLIVPCHRVINAGGKLGGYGGGLEAKARLLAMERSKPGPGRLL